MEEEGRRREQALSAGGVDAVYPEAAPAEEAAEQLVGPEGDAVAADEERQDACGPVHEVLHHAVADVLRPSSEELREGKTRVSTCSSRWCEEDEQITI